MLPLRRRLVPITAVLVGAPVSAEFLQGYLSTTGQVVALLSGIVFFAPLYGGAALLIREIAVRTGRGWVCRLLLAAAFGLAMTGVIDLSLFGATRADIPYWSELRAPTAIGALGLSVAPALSWVIGHVVMSIGAPLALLDALAPHHVGRPLLGRVGGVVLTAAWAGVAVAVFLDGRRTYGYTPTWWQAAGVLLVVGVLVITALHPRTRVAAAGVHLAPVPAWSVVLIGGVGKIALDVMPPTWPWVAATLVLLVGTVILIRGLARRRRWGAREIGLLAGAVVLTGAVLGLTTPPPDPDLAAAKYAQNVIFIVIAAVLVVLVVGRRRRVPA